MAASFLERFAKYKESSKTALVCGDISLTYKELYIRSARLASRLRSRGVGVLPTTPDSYDIYNPKSKNSPWVVIISERSVEAVIGVIATFMAGGAYVLAGADAPTAYIDGIIEDTAACVVLRNGDFGGSDFCETPLKLPKDDEIACAIFTSGSTGKPKGAVLEHRVINEMLGWQTEYMKREDMNATALYAPFGFIAALWEIFFPLANGLTLHILGEAVRQDIFALSEYIECKNISYMFLPPNAAEVFTKVYKGSSLKYLRVAGGQLNSCGRPNGYEIMYHLGMSENGGSVTFNSIHNKMSGDIPIGNAWHSTRVFLGKENGEMAVSGPSLFRGYLARREETLSRLIKNPYTDETGYEKAFISGDIARQNDKGELVHLGRSDWDVKISGMKVNPMQVEAVLIECAGVSECCVTAAVLGGENALVGWVAGDCDEEALKKVAFERLPEHMVPKIFVFMESLPRTVNGKIDRSRLVYRRAVTEPCGGLVDMSDDERQISELFSRVLKLSRLVGRDESFLALGGNSLALMRLQTEISLVLSKNVPYTVLFTKPTPRILADVLRDIPRKEEAEYIPQAADWQMYPLSPPMRQMWLLWRTGQDGGKYSVSIKCRFTGKLDITRVKSTFEDLIRRNAILRSRFEERDNEPYQVIEETHPEFSINTEKTVSRREFDLTKTPIFDITIDDNTLTFTTHHIIADATGMRALMEDFWTLYGGGVPQTSVQVHEASLLMEEAQKDESFWLKTFADGVPLLNLPADFVRPLKLNKAGNETVFFDANEAKALHEFAASYGATLFQLFLAGYAMLLSGLSGGGGVVIGVPFAGREKPCTGRTIGMFVKSLPVRLDINGMNLREALEHTRERFLDVWEEQGMSLSRLTEIISVPRLKSRNPFYDTMINYIPLPAHLPDTCGHKPEILRGEYPSPLFDIGLGLCEEQSGVSAVFVYASELFSPKTIRSWAETFRRLLLSGELELESVNAADNLTAEESDTYTFNELSASAQDLLGVVNAMLEELGRPPATLGDDFYSLGGTSLAAIRIEAAMLEKGWSLSAYDIMMNPILGHMAALIVSADDIDWES